MQDRKHRFGDEKEPSPIDAVQETCDSRIFVVADGFPFFCTCKEFCRGGYLHSVRNSLRGHHRLGLKNVRGWIIFTCRTEPNSRLRNKRRHPKMVGKSNPALIGHLDTNSVCTFAVINAVAFHCAVVIFGQFAVRHSNKTFVQYEKVFDVSRNTMTAD